MPQSSYSSDLVAIASAVFGTEPKIELADGTPSITPAGSSQSILGSAAVLSYLARLKNQLNAKTDEESAQIDQFLSLSAKLADELSSDATKGFTKLEQLNDTLASLTFLAGNKMTIADLALYAALAPAFQSLTTAQRFQIPRVSRHFDLIQRTLHSQPSGSKLPHPLVDIDLNRPATEVKKKEKKEDMSGKAEKPVASAPSAVVGAAAAPAKPAAAEKKAKEPKEAKAPKEPKAGGADKPAEAPADDKPDPSKIDFRVGLILSAEKHPNADSLYVEQIDVGEDKPRTVCSGLVAYIPSASDLVNKLVIVIANLKPAKMRGVESQAMLLAAEADGKVELVLAPESAKPGDRVTVEGYDGPADAQLNPKHKRWEAVQPHLSTSSEKQAVFLDPSEGGKAKLLKTGAGPLSVATLVGAKLR